MEEVLKWYFGTIEFGSDFGIDIRLFWSRNIDEIGGLKDLYFLMLGFLVASFLLSIAPRSV